MSKKLYQIGEHNQSNVWLVVVDLEQLTEQKLHQINNFWPDAEQYLTQAAGNVLIAVLRRLGETCNKLIHRPLKRSQLIEQFGCNFVNHELAGWPKMDGTAGFQLLDVTAIEPQVSVVTALQRDYSTLFNGFSALQQAIQYLNAMQIVILNYAHDGVSKPTITIAPHPYCEQLIQQGLAAYYHRLSPSDGVSQQGQFSLLGCRVIWQEPATHRIKGQPYAQ